MSTLTNEEQQPQPLPVIGVLCIDVAQELTKNYGKKVTSYIAASYVKYLEGAGARVVPIWIARNRAYYEEIMSKINGILLPGGAVWIEMDSRARTKYPELCNDCVKSAKFIYEIAIRKHQAGEHFPLWGTCLGFGMLVVLSKGDTIDLRADCESMNYSLPLEFDKEFRNSKLFEQLDKNLEFLMKTEPFGYHKHRYCITKEILQQFNVHDQWKVLGMNKDKNGLEFISIIEHTKYPFFGCQFHPERVAYDILSAGDTCVHSTNCIKAVRYFADFFVECCQKNKNHFESESELLHHLICNFVPTFTALSGAHWQQCYLFDAAPEYPNLYPEFENGELKEK